MNRAERAVLSLLLLTPAGCRAASVPGAEQPEPPIAGEIVACGERFPASVAVVRWFEEPHYDAYLTEPRFAAELPAGAERPSGLRYRAGRKVADPALAARVEREGWTLATLREQLDLFVVHYDACGTSRECFRVLQDVRGLSVHFLLDVDGTIYQTLDLADEAWHARVANPRSIGIEIAHIGAYPPEESEPLAEWYRAGEDGGVELVIPRELEGSLRVPGFSRRPARAEPVTGPIHGALYRQYDFTEEQYRSLAALLATLSELFPRIALEVPCDAAGAVRTDELSAAELERFHGVLGHHHVTREKRDPGPAFDWERVLREARLLRARP